MRILFRAVAFLVVLAMSTAPRAQDRFFEAIEDLPLMPGLIEVVEAATVFDSADGRIVHAYASGRVTAGAVEAFYADVLPALGWRATEQGGYRREREVLTLSVGPAPAGGDTVLVEVELAPAGR